MGFEVIWCGGDTVLRVGRGVREGEAEEEIQAECVVSTGGTKFEVIDFCLGVLDVICVLVEGGYSNVDLTKGAAGVEVWVEDVRRMEGVEDSRVSVVDVSRVSSRSASADHTRGHLADDSAIGPIVQTLLTEFEQIRLYQLYKQI